MATVWSLVGSSCDSESVSEWVLALALASTTREWERCQSGVDVDCCCIDNLWAPRKARKLTACTQDDADVVVAENDS